MQKNPTPTAANPQPATSSYLNAPKAIKLNPTIIIIVVAQANTVFLFIAIFQFFKGNTNIAFFKQKKHPVTECFFAINQL